MTEVRVLFFCSVVIFLLFLAAGCGKQKTDAVARSYDKYLYTSDLHDVVPSGVSGNDSVQLVTAYIEQWLRQQALLHQAQRNINVNNKEQLERQVEEYRNGLIIYEYEQALISQKLDTVVTLEEINAYYDTRKEMFALKQPILKVSYIRLKRDAPELDRVRRLFLSTEIKDQDLLEEYCAVYASQYELHNRDWHYVDELQNKIPILRISEDSYSKTGRIFEIIENNELYLIILHDSKFSDARSPLSMEQENIRNLILNKRKIDLIARMQKSIVDDARNKNHIEIYN